MKRNRITALALGVILVVAKWGIDQSTNPVAGPLEGTWEIVSVHREGNADLAQVGARLVFTGNEVRRQAPLMLWTDEALRQTELNIALAPLIYWPVPTAIPHSQYVT